MPYEKNWFAFTGPTPKIFDSSSIYLSFSVKTGSPAFLNSPFWKYSWIFNPIPFPIPGRSFTWSDETISLLKVDSAKMAF